MTDISRRSLITGVTSVALAGALPAHALASMTTRHPILLDAVIMYQKTSTAEFFTAWREMMDADLFASFPGVTYGGH